MRALHCVVIASLVCVLAQQAVANEAAEKAELEKFKGTWVFESITVNGEKQTPPPGTAITFEGTSMTMTMGDTSEKGKIKLNIATHPKQIDLSTDDGGFQEITEPGIYELTDETLKMCVAQQEVAVDDDGNQKPSAGKRPTAFDDKQGALIVLKRKPK